MKSNHEYKKALIIGTISVFSYIVCYYMRNILSVSTPAMLETRKFYKGISRHTVLNLHDSIRIRSTNKWRCR